MLKISNHRTNKKDKDTKVPFYLKNFVILVIALFLIIAVLGYLFLIHPAYNKYQTNKTLSTSNSTKLEDRKQGLAKLNQIIEAYQNISLVDKEKINDLLPDNPDEPSIYVNIETLAQELGLSLDDMVIKRVEKNKKGQKVVVAKQLPEEVVKKNQLQELTINFALSDVNYLDLKNLFVTLEKNLRLFDIQSFNFDPQEGKLDLTLISYFIE